AVQRYSLVPREGSVRQLLEALALADVEVLSEEEGFMKVVVREAMSFRSETYPLIIDHLAPYVRKVEEILVRGVASHEIREDQPTSQLALAFVGVLSMLFVQHWGSGGRWPTLDELPRLAATLFVDGAAGRAPRGRPSH
ncbi:MAG: hypothetical protein ACE5JX_16860, partial [Acidobacteriota bacterium]